MVRIAALVPILAMAACEVPAYVIAGAESRPPLPPLVRAEDEPGVRLRATARPRPLLEVHPRGILTGRPSRAEVLSHGRVPRTRAWRLDVGLERGLDASVVYTAPGGRPLPIRVGESIDLRLWDHMREGAYEGDALVVRETDGRLIAALSAGGGLPREVFGGKITFAASHELAYSEVATLDSMCLSLAEHRLLRVQIDGTNHLMAPGTVVSLPHAGGILRLVVQDVSEQLSGRCVDEAPSHMSFALIAVRELAGVSPTTPAR